MRMRIRTRIIGATLLVVLIASVVYSGYFIRKERNQAIALLEQQNRQSEAEALRQQAGSTVKLDDQ